MNALNQSLEVEVFESGIVVKHSDGHWISYTRPAETVRALPEQSRNRNADAGQSFDRFVREAPVVAYRAALKLNWVEVESAA